MDGLRQIGGRRGDRVGCRLLLAGLGGVDDRAVELVLLGAADDPVHHLHRIDRIAAGGRFRRKHDGVGAVVDGGRHVGGFGPRRRRGADHAVEHLGRDDDRLDRKAAGADQLLLAAGDFLVRDLDAEVAARDHDGVGQADDVLDLVESRRLFDLRDEAGAVADQAARFDQVAGLLHEGQGDPIDAKLQAEGEVGAVLGGERRQVENRAGQVDALAVGDRAADDDAGLDPVVAKAGRRGPAPVRRRSGGRGPA